MNTENQNNTNNNQKKQNIFVSLILIALFIGALFVYTNYYKGNILKKSVDENTAEAVKDLATNCGLTVTDPAKNAVVGGDFGITAILDNSNSELLGCSWTAFEAQTGVVYIKDGNGKDLAPARPLATQQDWMTDNPVQYSAYGGITDRTYNGPAFIIINEENPSDSKASKTILVPITIKQ